MRVLPAATLLNPHPRPPYPTSSISPSSIPSFVCFLMLLLMLQRSANTQHNQISSHVGASFAQVMPCLCTLRASTPIFAGAKRNVETRCSKIAHVGIIMLVLSMMPVLSVAACAIFEQRVSTLCLAPAVRSAKSGPRASTNATALSAVLRPLETS